MSIRLPGHSGFTVSFIDETTVRKAAKGPESARLRRQIQKQIDFKVNSESQQILIPRVLGQVENNGEYHADMEFVTGRDFIEFLTQSDRQGLDNFSSLIVAFIRGNLNQSVEAEVSQQILEKGKELAERGLPYRYIEKLTELCSRPVVIPVGPCHGDLTLSNILFKEKRLHLIDFLDAFVESPLQDIAKLRQDTQFGWSLELYKGEFDRTKILIALRFLDVRIHQAFCSEAWYGKHYGLFQFVNLMRVYPYCQNSRTLDFITAHLDTMLNELPEGNQTLRAGRA